MELTLQGLASQLGTEELVASTTSFELTFTYPIQRPTFLRGSVTDEGPECTYVPAEKANS